MPPDAAAGQPVRGETMAASFLYDQMADFVRIATRHNLGPVAFGGAIGGLLQPVVAQLDPRSESPPGVNFLLCPILGCVAAGVSVYVLANSDTTDPMRLMFFAVMCGLAFPAVLSTAVDNVAKRATKVQTQISAIAEQARSDGMEETARAAAELRNTLLRNLPDALTQSGKSMIENAAQQAIGNIAHTAVVNPELTTEVASELQEIAAVARTAGWQGAAESAARELEQLSKDAPDQQVRDATGLAADRAGRD